MTGAGRQLDWLVDDFARRVSGVRQALVVSGDGLRLATPPASTRASATSCPRSPPGWSA